MKETKVYVDELPENCRKCLFCYDNRPYWKSTDCLFLNKELDEDEIEIKREKDCPLIDIKTHDKEILEEQREKTFILYSLLYQELEKQDIENVASRIDYLTGKDYSDICELYKIAKNIKQHDRELVKEVCEIIREIGLQYNIEDLSGVFISYKALDQIQKEFEK